ncbi:hypothetical protein NL676_002586 [Syzygium grande]|nr:hypothetical protein NL676_002586 [Syzygium grande]
MREGQSRPSGEKDTVSWAGRVLGMDSIDLSFFGSKSWGVLKIGRPAPRAPKGGDLRRRNPKDGRFITRLYFAAPHQSFPWSDPRANSGRTLVDERTGRADEGLDRRRREPQEGDLVNLVRNPLGTETGRSWEEREKKGGGGAGLRRRPDGGVWSGLRVAASAGGSMTAVGPTAGETARCWFRLLSLNFFQKIGDLSVMDRGGRSRRNNAR